MNETGFYSAEELREVSVKCLEHDYQRVIQSIMETCSYAATTFGHMDIEIDIEKNSIEPIIAYFRLKGFNVKRLQEDTVIISWE